MRLKAFAILDTNILVSSLISNTGFTYDIIELVNSKNIIPIFDRRILCEYYKVLNYDKFKKSDTIKMYFSSEKIYDILYGIVNNGLFINNIKTAEEILRDRTDIPFFEVKISSSELNSYLITGNKKHFPKSNTIVTPKEMLGIMQYLDNFLSQDKDYDKIIKNIVETELNNENYKLSAELTDEMFDMENKKVKPEFFREKVIFTGEHQ